jgi:dihydrofolate synthase / folylpolyglutamate synthase
LAASDAILTRLLALHPKIIDLSLDRMWRILRLAGDPQTRLPPVIHVAGTNGKGSTIAFLRAILEAAGLRVHCYTSPHLVRFHERIRIAGEFIGEDRLSELLEQCEAVNGGAPITFFEITTAAAFLEFARVPADYLLLEVGLGGRLDATNVISRPRASVITPIDYDHQQYLGDTLTLIAREKAGIMKRGGPAIFAAQGDEARDALEDCAAEAGALPFIANQDWQVIEQHGRLVYHDEAGLLDLPLPQLQGPHQTGNAGTAIATLRAINDPRVSEQHMAAGLKSATWPARMQRLSGGELNALLPPGTELWLDGGHNPSAGQALARAFSDLNERHSAPLTLIWGMLNSKDAAQFIAPFTGLAQRVVAIAIPGEENAIDAPSLAEIARKQGMAALTSTSIEEALREAGSARILICGSLYLAGHVLAAQGGETMSKVSGAARR